MNKKGQEGGPIQSVGSIILKVVGLIVILLIIYIIYKNFDKITGLLPGF